MTILSMAVAAALAPIPLTPPEGAATDYSLNSNWLCLPRRADSCSTPLPTTALNPNGYGSTGRSSVAAKPKADCFYVYPTVSRDKGLNSDLTAMEEKGAALQQFARFAGACRTFAPVYRQMTLGAVTVAATGGDVSMAYALAYRDVAAAWRNYLATRNDRRPVILIGHSQGSLMLQQLIAREIDGKPAAKLLALAIIPGFNLMVPNGKLVGGTFGSIPLCSRLGQRGCAISYVSYRTANPPPAGAMFGHSSRAGMTVGCVNPARPGSRNWEGLDSYWAARSQTPAPGGPIVWSSEGPPPSPFLRTEGLISGRCVNAGQRGYLEIRVNADPADKRTDRVGGEVGVGGFFLPGWGMHLNDIPFAQGDLIRAVEAVAR